MTEQSDIDHLPRFRGDKEDTISLDAMLAYGYSQRDLEDSRSLFSSKWWDYRFMHLGHSMMLFTHYYGEAVERWRSKFGVPAFARLDHLFHPMYRQKRDSKGVKQTVLAPTATRTGWLRATLFADVWGIPYDKWIEWAFEFAFEYNWQKLPTPTQLYGDGMVMYIHRKWQEECKELMTLPRDPKYLADNYIGHKWQDEFQNWLLDTIAERPRPEIALRHYIFTEPYVVVERARQKLGDTIVNRALRV